MKKKNWITELILAAIFIAASASGVVISTNNNNTNANQPKECLIFDMDLTMLKGTVVKDEQGSEHVHLEFVPCKMRRVLYYSPNAIKYICYEGQTPNGKSLSGKGSLHQAIVVMNAFEGETDGYLTFDTNIAALDKYTPSVNIRLSGRTKNKWDDELGRYVLVSGSGVVSGSSNPTFWDAWADLNKAVPSVQSSLAPAWGTFTVRRAVLSNNEIVELIK